MEEEIEVDGVWYQELSDYIICGVLDLCVCVDQEGIIMLMDKTFYHFDTWTKRNVYWETLVKDVFDGNEVFDYTLVGLMDSKDLLEHGSSIRGGWLTNRG
jgi:hypothetical protein